MESSGPHIPASQRKAVPFGKILSSAVCTWVWVPTTSETEPSRWRPMAIFSLVVSPWTSTMITGVSFLSFSTSAEAAKKGLSRGVFMKVLHWRFMTPIGPWAVSRMMLPPPGVPAG